MRLIHLADFPNRHESSFIPMVRGILAAGRERGWSIDSVFPEVVSGAAWVRELEASGVPVHLVRMGSRRDLTAAVARLVQEDPGPAILHTHFTAFDVPAALAARGEERPLWVFWHIHTALSDSPVAVARNMAKFLLLGRNVAGVLCPSGNIATSVRRRLAPSRMVHEIPSPIDARRFPLAGQDRRRIARRELGLPESARVLLHFGWDPHIKGTDRFLAAVAALRERGREDIVALVMGDFGLRKLANRYGVGEITIIHAPVRDAATLYAAASLVVAPSRDEGMPFSIGEALASGTPVVTTNLPGPAYLGRNVEACVISSPDAEPLADAIEALLERPPEQAAAEARAGRGWVVANVSPREISERVVRLYEQAIRSPGGHAS